MSDVTLLFGIGATKAGTSWLQFFLERHPQVHLWVHKELHYFDTLDEKNLMWQMDQLCEKRMGLRLKMKEAPDQETRKRLRFEVGEIDRWLGVLARDKEAPGAYLSFLKKGRAGKPVVGDITPAYALLSEERLQMMYRLNPATKFVYLLRDPISRLWSNVRMMAGWGGGSENEISDRANRIFDRWSKGKEEALGARCDYAGPLSRLTKVVPEADRFIGFYETLFSKETVDTLCRFIGIDGMEAPLERRVHVSARIEMDAGRRAIAAERLAPQYDYVQTMFGRMPERWSPS
ncbi:MAG: sulfotransferase [Dinoroseobacter sp.]|nr:sulfotransferase [Dinoroseobacter sp.]